MDRVGKTSILTRYINGNWVEQHKATVGADFMTKEIVVDNKVINL